MKHMVNKALRYTKVWLMMSKNAFLVTLSNKTILFIFLTGKLLRFGFFLSFLFFIVRGSESIAGYNLNQAAFFFLTFSVIDIVAQFLFREVYRFRSKVVRGDLDLILAKPISALFRVLLGGADVIDLVTIPPLFVATYYVGSLLSPNPAQTFFYLLLLVNGLLIATAFHIAVLSLAIITFEIDHSIMIYRDVTNLGRLPVDIYKEPLRGILTFLVPVGVMITLPAKALMGLVSPLGVFLSFVFGGMLVFFSLKFWGFALKKYTSASS